MEAGVEIAFGARPGILIVAEIVGGVGHQFDNRHAEIGGQAFLPGRIALGDQVHHQAAETLIVLGEIVERGFVANGGRTVGKHAAVEFAWTRRLETEHFLIAFEIHRRMIDLKDIGREIALAIDQHAQHEGIGRHRLDVDDAQVDDANAAGDAEIGNADRRWHGRHLEEGDVKHETVQRLAPELDEVDAVQRMRGIEQDARAPLVFTPQRTVLGEHGHTLTSRWNWMPENVFSPFPCFTPHVRNLDFERRLVRRCLDLL